ncbi:DUF6578 domain-containing protein [Nonomuraea fastidiosa]|uniref:DUF6578 domain-containing protein n=1 Tax=Nonomuraea TaxID=83681 RepID=UPI00324B2F60
MKVNVWVVEWQMACCGDPFSVGSEVSWTLAPADRKWLTQALGEETAATIEWVEEHHDEPTPDYITVEGQVTGISQIYVRYEYALNERDPHPAGGVLVPVHSTHGVDRPSDLGRDFSCIGWVATLDVPS